MSEVKTIPIAEIEVGSRIRGDLGSIEGLADSIKRNGLIQPIVITHDKRLVAGERRLRAHEKLGLVDIKYIYADEIDEDEKAEIEFSENFFRKQMHWTEEALGILNIYRKKKSQGALRGWQESWQKVIGEMLNMSVGNVNYVLAVARELEKERSMPEEQRRFHKFDNACSAYRQGLLSDEAAKFEALAAQRQAERRQTEAQRIAEQVIVQEVARVEAAPDLLADERAKYESNPHNKVPFDEYWAGKQAQVDEIRNTVHLSTFLLNEDCIQVMKDRGPFDHIITDPPYAIDMRHLNQQNQQGGLVGLDRLEDAHQVEENLTLLSKFWPAAWNATKDHSFVVMFCDMMQWQFLYDLATDAGFAVQRWPFLWRKVNQSLMNNSPQYNTTKSYEPVMIARKPGAVKANSTYNRSDFDAGNTVATKETGHGFAKPYELTQLFIDMVSTKGQCIFEPFMGGGSIALQILRSERHLIACEKDPEWYNQASNNIKQLYFLKHNPKAVFK